MDAPQPGTSSPEARRFRELLIGLGRYRPLRDPLASMCEDLQLTSAQVHAIIWLGREEPLTMGILARRVGITDKTITGVVDRLEGMGLVERVRAPDDRRAISVRLTSSGQSIYGQLIEHIDAGLDQTLALLEAEDHAVLLGILERFSQRLEALHASTSGSKGAGSSRPAREEGPLQEGR